MLVRQSSTMSTPVMSFFLEHVQFDGAAGEKLCHTCSVFAANQAKGDKLLKEWRRKNEWFRAFLKLDVSC